MSWSEVVVNRRKTIEGWAEQLRLSLEPQEFDSIPWVFRMTPPQEYSAWRICHIFPHNMWPNMIVVRSAVFLTDAFHNLTQEKKKYVLRDLSLRLSMAFPLVETTLEPPYDEEDETDRGYLVMLTGTRVGEDVRTSHSFMNWLTTFQRALAVGELVLTEFES